MKRTCPRCLIPLHIGKKRSGPTKAASRCPDCGMRQFAPEASHAGGKFYVERASDYDKVFPGSFTVEERDHA